VLNYSSRTLSSFFQNAIKQSEEDETKLLVILKMFLQQIPKREWNSPQNRDVVATWVDRSFGSSSSDSAGIIDA